MLRGRESHTSTGVSCRDKRLRLRSNIRSSNNNNTVQEHRSQPVHSVADSFNEESDSVEDIQTWSDDLDGSDSDYVASHTCLSLSVTGVDRTTPLSDAPVHVGEQSRHHDKTQSICSEKSRISQQYTSLPPESSYATAFVVRAAQLLNQVK